MNRLLKAAGIVLSCFAVCSARAAPYFPITVNFEVSEPQFDIRLRTLNTPTVRAYLRQGTNVFNPSSYNAYLAWGRDAYATSMVYVTGTVYSTYIDFDVLSNNLAYPVKRWYSAIMLTKPLEDKVHSVGYGYMTIDPAPEVGAGDILLATSAINGSQYGPFTGDFSEWPFVLKEDQAGGYVTAGTYAAATNYLYGLTFSNAAYTARAATAYSWGNWATNGLATTQQVAAVSNWAKAAIDDIGGGISEEDDPIFVDWYDTQGVGALLPNLKLATNDWNDQLYYLGLWSNTVKGATNWLYARSTNHLQRITSLEAIVAWLDWPMDYTPLSIVEGLQSATSRVYDVEQSAEWFESALGAVSNDLDLAEARIVELQGASNALNARVAAGETAYSWGNHATNGYTTESALTNASMWAYYKALGPVDFNDMSASNMSRLTLAYQYVYDAEQLKDDAQCWTNSGTATRCSDWYKPDAGIGDIPIVMATPYYWEVNKPFTTTYLVSSNYGLNVSTNKFMTGIRVKVVHGMNLNVSGGDVYITGSVFLVKADGTVSATNSVLLHSQGQFEAAKGWTVSTSYFPSVSDNTNLWGMEVTPAEINSNKFSVYLQVSKVGTVAYTLPNISIFDVELESFSGSSVPVTFESQVGGLMVEVSGSNAFHITPTGVHFFAKAYQNGVEFTTQALVSASFLQGVSNNMTYENNALVIEFNTNYPSAEEIEALYPRTNPSNYVDGTTYSNALSAIGNATNSMLDSISNLVNNTGSVAEVLSALGGATNALDDRMAQVEGLDSVTNWSHYLATSNINFRVFSHITGTNVVVSGSNLVPDVSGVWAYDGEYFGSNSWVKDVNGTNWYIFYDGGEYGFKLWVIYTAKLAMSGGAYGWTNNAESGSYVPIYRSEDPMTEGSPVVAVVTNMTVTNWSMGTNAAGNFSFRYGDDDRMAFYPGSNVLKGVVYGDGGGLTNLSVGLFDGAALSNAVSNLNASTNDLAGRVAAAEGRTSVWEQAAADGAAATGAVAVLQVATNELNFRVGTLEAGSTYPVFHIPLGESWTDFEIKASTDNFANLLYYYRSWTNDAGDNTDSDPMVLFTDDYVADVRKQFRKTNDVSVYRHLLSEDSIVRDVYFYPSTNHANPSHVWMYATNANLIWSWVRFDELGPQENVNGSKQSWNKIEPIAWTAQRPANVQWGEIVDEKEPSTAETIITLRTNIFDGTNCVYFVSPFNGSNYVIAIP